MSAPTASSISPAIRYKNGRAAAAFLKSAFGFEEQAMYLNADGSIAHCELRLGPDVIGVNSAGPVDPSNPWTMVRHGVYVCTDSPDALHAMAIAAGAAIVTPLEDKDYGSREFAARDCGGHLWSFGTYGFKVGERPQMFVGLDYDDTRAALAFLRDAFGFATSLEIPGADGHVAHAELTLGAGVVMVEHGPNDRAKWGSDRQRVYVYVADPDAHFARASASGAHIIEAIADTSWGSRGYYARDTEGFVWGFSNYKPA